MGSPSELRVFVSSTFIDLRAERELLVRTIFPELRAYCRERGISFAEVDLRWGVTDEDQVLGHLFRTCLEEIDNCRPYFIGLTGDRYGYIPQLHEIHKDPDLLTRYPWVEDAVMDEASIIDMEFRYGVLDDPVSRGSSRFFFRTYREGMEIEERLEELKDRVRASGAFVAEFSDPAELGRMIREELLGVIESDFPDAVPPTPLEQERARHEAFASSRRKAYIPNATYLKCLNDHAAGSGPPLVVYAGSGAGKSALLSFWAEQYRRRHPDAHVVEHYVGIGAGAADHYAIMHRIMSEIRERFGRSETVPSIPREIMREFPNWLGFTTGRPLVLILDAVNQLSGAALNLDWLPAFIPRNIRLVVSSTMESTLAQLRKRNWSPLEVLPLTVKEREAIVVRFLSEYRKALGADLVRRISEDEKCSQPLFLRTLLEELRLFGRHSLLAGRIEHYLATTGPEDLFRMVLERLEEDFGRDEISDVMSLIWASRDGLTEDDLVAITGIPQPTISMVAMGLDYHLLTKNGIRTFFHDYLRRAVEVRYLNEEETRRSQHLRLADYAERVITAEPATAPLFRFARELPAQLHAAGARDRLCDVLADIRIFTVLYTDEIKYEFISYWVNLYREFDMEAAYRRGLERWEAGSPDPDTKGRVLDSVIDVLGALGRWDTAEAMQRERLANVIREGERKVEAVSRSRLGRLLRIRGDHEAGLTELQRAKDLFRELGDLSGLVVALGYEGLLHGQRGSNDRALECYSEQERISREIGDRYHQARALSDMGNLHLEWGNVKQALEFFGLQESICRELGDRQGLSLGIVRAGIAYIQLDEMDEAFDHLREGVAICRELGDHTALVGALYNLGTVHIRRGEHDAAGECFREVGSLGSLFNSPRISATAEIGWGGICWGRREYDRALYHYGNALRQFRSVGARAYETVALIRFAEVMTDLVERNAPGHLPEFVLDHVPSTELRIVIEHVRKYIAEGMAIARDLRSQRFHLSGGILIARLDAVEGRQAEAGRRLLEMLETDMGDADRADLHYRLWRLSFASSGRHSSHEIAIDHARHRRESAALYEMLQKNKPYARYDKRLEELRASGV